LLSNGTGKLRLHKIVHKGQHAGLVGLQPIEQVLGRALFLAPALLRNRLIGFGWRIGLQPLLNQLPIAGCKSCLFGFRSVI